MEVPNLFLCLSDCDLLYRLITGNIECRNVKLLRCNIFSEFRLLSRRYEISCNSHIVKMIFVTKCSGAVSRSQFQGAIFSCSQIHFGFPPIKRVLNYLFEPVLDIIWYMMDKFIGQIFYMVSDVMKRFMTETLIICQIKI